MTFTIVPLHKYLVGHKPEPNRPHHVFEHSSNGFLVTGYEDGSDWLVSPLGRLTYGGVIRERPQSGWAIAADRRDFHRMHLYILDFPARSFRKVDRLPLTRDVRIVDYDAGRLVCLCPPAAEPKSKARDIVVIDIESARIADRFALAGLSHFFFTPIGCSPDGWISIDASPIGENNERLHAGGDPRYVRGVARIHPPTREVAFEIFPAHEQYEPFAISPSGRYVLTASKSVQPVSQSVSRGNVADGAGEAGLLYERSIEVWTGNPLRHLRNLRLEWVNTDEGWKLPLASLRIIWQPDETAFWWATQYQAICVGLDGRSSPPIRLNNHGAIFSARPGRIAELTFERATTVDLYRLDGSPSEDLSPVDAPAPTVMTPSAAEMQRHQRAQAELTAIVSAKSELRFTVKTAEADDIVDAIDAITSALDRGLRWYSDDEGIVKLTVKIAGESYDEARFFALVEKLGPVAAPALTRLLTKCRADPDLYCAWSGELEDGRQAFGAAAKALGGIDPGAWAELAAFEMCIDDYHESFFRSEVLPHFLRTHGWCEESFAFALSDIVQLRGNLGDNFVHAWRGSGLAAAAEAKHSPRAFAEKMIAVRDRMLCSLTGSFAGFVERTTKAPAPAYGWHNYDRLFDQLKGNLTEWEAQVSEELKRKSSA